MIESTKADVRFEKAIVARGRTIVVPSRTKTIAAGETAEGKPILRPVQESFGPGEEIEIPAADVARLRAAGYLVDPTTTAPPLVDPVSNKIVGSQSFRPEGPGPVAFSFRH